jgi:hypothetical protein
MGVISVGSSLSNIGRSDKVNSLNQSLDYKKRRKIIRIRRRRRGA